MDQNNLQQPVEQNVQPAAAPSNGKALVAMICGIIGVIGGFNGWSEADEPSFTYNVTDNVWESPVISFDGSSGWLVRLNKSWDYKYGGAVASTEIEGGFELSQGGSDIPSPAAGDYIVKLHTNRTPFVIEYVKQ